MKPPSVPMRSTPKVSRMVQPFGTRSCAQFKILKMTEKRKQLSPRDKASPKHLFTISNLKDLLFIY